MEKLARHKHWWLGAILIVSASLKIGLSLGSTLPFNADESIVALMARHILAGERPIFFYGQAYMGSLDAYLVALGFLIAGSHVWVIRLIQGLLYLGTVYTTYGLGVVLFRSPPIGLIAAALMAVPTVNVTLYTSVTLGGYGEALLLGNLILWTGIKLTKGLEFLNQKSLQGVPVKRIGVYLAFCLFGFLIGVGIWANALTLVYVLPVSVYGLYHLTLQRRGLSLSRCIGAGLLTAVGFFAGSFQWWQFAAQNGLTALLGELSGSAVAVEQGSWLTQFFSHLVNFALLGTTAILGLRPPWEIRWLVLPLLPFILIVWGWLAYSAIKKVFRSPDQKAEYLLLIGIMGTLLAGFLVTHFGVDPSGRYFLPFAVPLALITADRMISLDENRKRIGWGILILLIGYQLEGTIECAFNTPPGLTTQFDAATIIDHRYDGQLISFLLSQNETTGYTNYWTAYPVAFQSDEQIVLVPRLPYHLDFRYTARDDRYLRYDDIVLHSQKTVYVTTRHPELNARLRLAFTHHGIQWEEKVIGDYQVFYHLSSPIRPEEIYLGPDK